MKYDLTQPCDDCPFRKSTAFSFKKSRAQGILYADGGFSCHKTTTQKGKKNDDKNAQSCAGRMILLEKENMPDQMMRICERIRVYDRTKLKMDDPDVFDSIEEFMEARIE